MRLPLKNAEIRRCFVFSIKLAFILRPREALEESGQRILRVRSLRRCFGVQGETGRLRSCAHLREQCVHLLGELAAACFGVVEALLRIF